MTRECQRIKVRSRLGRSSSHELTLLSHRTRLLLEPTRSWASARRRIVSSGLHSYRRTLALTFSSLATPLIPLLASCHRHPPTLTTVPQSVKRSTPSSTRRSRRWPSSMASSAASGYSTEVPRLSIVCECAPSCRLGSLSRVSSSSAKQQARLGADFLSRLDRWAKIVNAVAKPDGALAKTGNVHCAKVATSLEDGRGE